MSIHKGVSSDWVGGDVGFPLGELLLPVRRLPKYKLTHSLNLRLALLLVNSLLKELVRMRPSWEEPDSYNRPPARLLFPPALFRT
jgi:hypothetical protein